MKKLIIILSISGILLLLGCEAKAPTPAKMNITTQNLILRNMVAVGNSLTAGFQSAGLVEQFQENSYPNLIAKQMGNTNFQMPLISSPGLGSSSVKTAGYASTPLYLNNLGQIVYDSIPLTTAAALPSNTTLSRPYDDMAVPGATLADILNATTPANSSDPANLFFQIILRNVPTAQIPYAPLGNMTAIDQALFLNPSLLLLWIGNNDVLGAALSGTAVEGVTITPQADFENMFTQLIQKIKKYSHTQIVMANIPDVANIPYVNTIPPVVINPITFQPVLINGNPVPWVMEETNVQYVLLSAFDSLKAGVGLPAMLGGTGRPLGGEFTLTTDEVTTIEAAVTGFNSTIGALAVQYQIPVVDANAMLADLNSGNIAGFSGKFVLLAPANTAFSLDGVHPNNAGYALLANEFIKKMNAAFGSSIPELDATQYLGQYGGTSVAGIAPGALAHVKDIFMSKN